jgi:hypothetical protein
VDDFVLFGRGKAELGKALRAIQGFLCGLRLRVHPRKSRVQGTSAGFRFLGWRIFPDRLRLDRGNIIRFRRRLRGIQESYKCGEIDLNGATARIRSWIAHASHGNTWRLRQQIFAEAAFERVERGLTCAAVRGTTMPGTRASRIATTTSPATGTTT